MPRKPKNNESEDDYMDYCMSDDTMNKEYPDEKQRYAVCQSHWDKEQNTMPENKEVRTLPLEMRVEGNESKKIAGYAAMFNSWSDDLGGFREKIAPDAFKKTLKNADVRALFNHDANFVLGRTTNGTLTLKEDKTGLYMEADPPDTSAARDVMALIERGDITQQSFAFRVNKDRWTYNESDEIDERELLDVELFDVSPVTYPAYPDTTVALRSLEKQKQSRNAETSGDESAKAESRGRMRLLRCKTAQYKHTLKK